MMCSHVCIPLLVLYHSVCYWVGREVQNAMGNLSNEEGSFIYISSRTRAGILSSMM